jgi:hypothetical protein
VALLHCSFPLSPFPCLYYTVPVLCPLFCGCITLFLSFVPFSVAVLHSSCNSVVAALHCSFPLSPFLWLYYSVSVLCPILCGCITLFLSFDPFSVLYSTVPVLCPLSVALFHCSCPFFLCSSVSKSSGSSEYSHPMQGTVSAN